MIHLIWSQLTFKWQCLKKECYQKISFLSDEHNVSTDKIQELFEMANKVNDFLQLQCQA